LSTLGPSLPPIWQLNCWFRPSFTLLWVLFSPFDGRRFMFFFSFPLLPAFLFFTPDRVFSSKRNPRFLSVFILSSCVHSPSHTPITTRLFGVVPALTVSCPITFPPAMSSFSFNRLVFLITGFLSPGFFCCSVFPGGSPVSLLFPRLFFFFSEFVTSNQTISPF